MPDTRINLESEKNADALRVAISGMNRRLEKIIQGGGPPPVNALIISSTPVHRGSKWVPLPATVCMKNTAAVRPAG
ncbi:MAG: hypothetical protein LW693_14380 [Saprospiraceae bacterium]|nr:hypothetical protein [Saprospiraceae bacterium]